MKSHRRSFLTSAMGAGLAGLSPAHAVQSKAKNGSSSRPDVRELDKAVALPVLRTDGLKSPVVIESIKLLKKDRDYFVRVRSKDGAEGISLTNPPREEYLDKILNQLVIPFFIGKDARDLDNLLWELYRFKDNYKLHWLALWSPQAWVEFAILDLLGRIAGKSMGALLGDIVRKDVA